MTAPPETGHTPAIVTLKTVYDEVITVKDTLNGANIPDIKSDLHDHEYRLRELEKWVWRASSLAALAGAGLSQMISVFFAKI